MRTMRHIFNGRAAVSYGTQLLKEHGTLSVSVRKVDNGVYLSMGAGEWAEDAEGLNDEEGAE